MTEAILNSSRDLSRSGSRRLRQELAANIRSCRTFPAVVEQPCPANPYAWLIGQPHELKLIWGDRNAACVTAGLGAAARIVAHDDEPAAAVIDRCRHALRGLPQLRCYGGFAFRRRTAQRDPRWQALGAGSFWLPRAVLSEGRLRIVLLDATDVPAALAFVEHLVDRADQDQPPQLVPWIERTDAPDRQQWSRCVETALELFRDEVLEKIVLARRVDLTFAERLAPLALLARLAAVTPACYHFGFQTSTHVGFIGASPERLFLREGSTLSSEVIAGTRPRGTTDVDDQRLGQQLLASAKDQLEHDIVRKSIRQRLHACVDRLEVDARASLLKLATKQHLFSRVQGRLIGNVSDGELIERLHPTPAVGGYPTENALDAIDQLEPFERGWYAAPVGWVSQSAAEFAVAIRSGLVYDHQLSLYSGAGIVPGSTALDEWDEIEHKISDFLQLLAWRQGRQPDRG
jgi:menaquinone-specific isochorismate synthase